MDDFPSRRDEPGSELMTKTKYLELNSNLAAAVSYIPFCLANVIFSLLWIKTEPQSNHYVRKHAYQSLMITGGAAALGFVIFVLTAICNFIPFVGWIGGLLISLLGMPIGFVYLLLNLYMIYSAYNNKTVTIPYITALADEYERRN